MGNRAHSAYISYRDFVVVKVFYYYGFTPSPLHLTSHPAYHVASIVCAALLFRKALYASQLAPDSVKEGPLCMDSDRWMFNCCRMPGLPADWAVSYVGELASKGKSGHVVEIWRNWFWKVSVDDG
ncbi:CoA-dependent acyltransferase [Calocera cornea HHB12733]|uniref:CoA-dependent acyltransferase n=1 Tax=Calocera cornea HHB12733 TaxID=1353952 RepID=A0A165EXQ9_9BASI|nr:CoA-dependent acyltransferase [Calocera cornea HHB12733]